MVMRPNTPVKKPDPGRYTIPCEINGKVGSSVNLMPKSLARKLGINEPKTTNMVLVLADGSTNHPEGTIENMLIKTGELEFLMDFVILDMIEDETIPLLLGRNFLMTARATIDVGEGRITFETTLKTMNFLMDNVQKK